jgi:RNA polymerase sigma-70 factor (ECF subfamily)
MTKEKFTALLTPHLQPIRRLVHSRLRGDQADDVLQQTLLRAFTRRHQLREHAKFKSWLWSIAINEVRMLLRGSRPFVSIDEFAHFDHMDQRPSPHALYEEREHSERVRAGLAMLSHRDRTAIHMADLNDMTARQAAGVLGVSVPAFKSTHFRARQRLANALRRAA